MRRGLAGIVLAAIALAQSICPAWGDEIQLHLKTSTVYIMPMAYGLDAYLANRLTNAKVLGVVVTPEKADAVLTDRVDEVFRAWTRTHYEADGPPSATRSRARATLNPGTLFLVDPKSGTVLWSTYEPVSRTSPAALDQVALQVAKRLQQSLNPK